jgi:periplasmic divalent cation tolerance protein
MATDKLVVLVTCQSAREARRIAQSLVEKHLIACANILQVPVQSIYRWQGKVQTGKEVLMLVKSSRAKFSALQKEIQLMHSYDVPEIIALPIATGSRDYLSWMSESLCPAAASSKKS